MSSQSTYCVRRRVDDVLHCLCVRQCLAQYHVHRTERAIQWLGQQCWCDLEHSRLASECRIASTSRVTLPPLACPIEPACSRTWVVPLCTCDFRITSLYDVDSTTLCVDEYVLVL